MSRPASAYLAHLHSTTRFRLEACVDSFVLKTLELLDFHDRSMILIPHLIIPLAICGELKRAAETDIGLVDVRKSAILLVVEDKIPTNTTNREAQVIAQAIGTFQFNNEQRKQLGRNTLDAMTVPYITVSGTRPMFYLVPITRALSDAVFLGAYPTATTRVLRCDTTATHQTYAGNGMVDPQYRKLALGRFLAFRETARRCWTQFV